MTPRSKLDCYAGIKPTWGPLTFDFGVIYYTYPGDGFTLAADSADLDYVEARLVSVARRSPTLTVGATVYYSDDSFGSTGEVWTVEGTAAYTFHTIGPFTPTISGVLGHVESEDPAYLAFNGFDSYTYWNAGVALAVEKLTFDFRYWDTEHRERDFDDLLQLHQRLLRRAVRVQRHGRAALSSDGIELYTRTGPRNRPRFASFA